MILVDNVLVSVQAYTFVNPYVRQICTLMPQQRIKLPRFDTAGAKFAPAFSIYTQTVSLNPEIGQTVIANMNNKQHYVCFLP